MSKGVEGSFYLQQFSAWTSFLHVHLKTAGKEGLEDRRQLLRTLQLRSPIGSDQIQSLKPEKWHG